MTSSWAEWLEPLIWNRTQLRQSRLEDALRGVRTEIPAFDVVGAGTPEASLHWSAHPVRLSEPLDPAFWETMTLSQADDEELVRFARRFGPLVWPGRVPATKADDSFVPAASHAGDDQPSSELPFVEPLEAWWLYARGLRALYDLTDPALPRDATDADTRMWAITAIAVPDWLRRTERPTPPLTEELVPNVAMELALGEHFFPGPGIAPPEQLVERALEVAGVVPAYLPDQPPAAGLVYTVPATATQSADSERLWQVRGLAPILAVSLTFATRTQERPRCTWCGNPAAILTRAPRRGQPWFGDHVMCRAEARAQAMNKAEEKRAMKRKQQVERDRARSSS